MKRFALVGLAAAAVALGVAFSGAANAALYDFSYVDSATDGVQINASGTITTGAAAGGGYFEITDIIGTRNGFAITGLAPFNGYASNDNLFSPSPTYFTFPGVSFSVADGFDYNLANNGVNVYTDDSSQTDPGGYAQTPINLTISAVPEPMSLVLVAAGLIGLGMVSSRRTAQTA